MNYTKKNGQDKGMNIKRGKNLRISNKNKIFNFFAYTFSKLRKSPNVSQYFIIFLKKKTKFLTCFLN